MMKVNSAKQKMLGGEAAFGYSAKLGSPVAAELLSQSGADFVLLDGQHGCWGPEAMVAGITAVCAGAAVPMARVSFNTYTLIGQLLDAGLLGIIIPMVNTVEEARAAAAACRYPPVGERSFGWGRAMSYAEDYTDWIDDQLFVAVQIESVQAVENAEAIMAVKGIDGCMTGPQDLALSMGFHPRDIPKHDEHVRALEHIVQACRNTGKIPGIDTGAPNQVALRVKQGFRFIPMGNDVKFLTGGAAAGLNLAKEAIAR